MDRTGPGSEVDREMHPGGRLHVSPSPGWVDLSMPLSEDIPRWKVHFESVYGGSAHKASVITLPIHAGTHLDAPLHYVEGGASVDQFPLQLVLSEALIVDLTHAKANQRIELADVAPVFPEDHPRTLLLRTDWPRRAFRTPGFWSEAPFISEELAGWLVERGIEIIGFDFPQEEAIKALVAGEECAAEDFTIHQLFLGRGVWQIEYLINLHQLASTRAQLIISPLALVGLDGSPVRVLGRALE